MPLHFRFCRSVASKTNFQAIIVLFSLFSSSSSSHSQSAEDVGRSNFLNFCLLFFVPVRAYYSFLHLWDEFSVFSMQETVITLVLFFSLCLLKERRLNADCRSQYKFAETIFRFRRTRAGVGVGSGSRVGRWWRICMPTFSFYSSSSSSSLLHDRMSAWQKHVAAWLTTNFFVEVITEPPCSWVLLVPHVSTLVCLIYSSWL